MKCVFRVSLQILSEIFFILRRSEGDVIIKVYWPSWKVTFILVQLIFSTDFDKILKYQI